MARWLLFEYWTVANILKNITININMFLFLFDTININIFLFDITYFVGNSTQQYHLLWVDPGKSQFL